MMFCWILISLLIRFLKAQENPIVIYAQVGGKVTLPIQGNLGQNAYVNWYNGSETSPTISRNPQNTFPKGSERKSLLSDFSLQISPVLESDFVTWRCEQHLSSKDYTHTYKLFKVTIPKVPAVLVNGTLNLICNMESNSVTPTVTWISPNRSDCSQIRRHKGTSVSITKASFCDSGLWTCLLEYKGRITEATTTVHVIDLSASSSVYTSISSSSTVNIPCSLSSKIPWSVLNENGLQGGSWTFTSLGEQNQQRPPQTLLSLKVGPVVRWDVPDGTNKTIKGGEVKDENLSIRNLPVSVNIRGVYTCSLEFKTKTLVSKVNVEVLQVLSSGGFRVYEGQRVNLSCTLGHENTSGLKVKWTRYSNPTLPNPTPDPFVLSIPEVQMKHSGRWTCELRKNNETLTSAVLSLKIEKAPVDVWLFVAIASGVVVFILLIVVVIIGIRRYKQRMMYRRRKTRFCCCKSPQPKGFYKT